MIQLPNNWFQDIPAAYKIVTIGGGLLWSIFKALEWVKSIKYKDLAHLNEGVTNLKTEMKTQTESIVGAISDNTKQLSELRTVLLSALIAPIPQARPARAARRKK